MFSADVTCQFAKIYQGFCQTLENKEKITSQRGELNPSIKIPPIPLTNDELPPQKHKVMILFRGWGQKYIYTPGRLKHTYTDKMEKTSQDKEWLGKLNIFCNELDDFMKSNREVNLTGDLREISEKKYPTLYNMCRNHCEYRHGMDMKNTEIKTLAKDVSKKANDVFRGVVSNRFVFPLCDNETPCFHSPLTCAMALAVEHMNL